MSSILPPLSDPADPAPADAAVLVDAAPAADAGASADAAVPVHVVSPAATALQLRQLFPALFGGAPKPLKLRIQVDIQERAPGVFGKQALSAFFRRYTGSHAYLQAVSRASHRFDLDGVPSGELSDEHRQAAIQELARRRGNHQARLAQEEQERRNRASLLHDHRTTTLTPANFCALKGIAIDELEPLLEIARREADERPRPAPVFEQARRLEPRRPEPRRSGHGGGKPSG